MGYIDRNINCALLVHILLVLTIKISVSQVIEVGALLSPTRICFNSMTSNFQSQCVYCSRRMFVGTILACTSQATLPVNITQAQAFCIATACLQVRTLLPKLNSSHVVTILQQQRARRSLIADYQQASPSPAPATSTQKPAASTEPSSSPAPAPALTTTPNPVPSTTKTPTSSTTSSAAPTSLPKPTTTPTPAPLSTTTVKPSLTPESRPASKPIKSSDSSRNNSQTSSELTNGSNNRFRIMFAKFQANTNLQFEKIRLTLNSLMSRLSLKKMATNIEDTGDGGLAMTSGLQ